MHRLHLKFRFNDTEKTHEI